MHGSGDKVAIRLTIVSLKDVGGEVIQVEADSPAAVAGLLGGDQILDLDGEQIFVGGDVITEFDGDTITDMHRLRQLLVNAEIGQEVKLTVLRGGELIEVTLTLAERLG